MAGLGLLLFFQKQVSLGEYVYVYGLKGEITHFSQLGEFSSSLFPGHIKNTSPTAELCWWDNCLGDSGGQNKLINLSGWASCPPSLSETWTAVFLATHLQRMKFLRKSLFKCRIQLRVTLSLIMLTPVWFILYSALFHHAGDAEVGAVSVSLCTVVPGAKPEFLAALCSREG